MNKKVNICTYKQVDRLLSNIQKSITDIRDKENCYLNKNVNEVRFPKVYSKKGYYINGKQVRNGVLLKDVLTDYEKGYYYGKLAGLKYARNNIKNFRNEINTFMQDNKDRELEKLYNKSISSVSIYDDVKEDNVVSSTNKTKVKVHKVKK